MAFLNRDVWVGAVMLIVAAVFWNEASKIRVSPLDDPVGAAGLPKALAWALGALAVVLILRSVVGTWLARRAGVPKEGRSDESLSEQIKPHLRAIAMLAIGVGYLLLIGLLGYTVSIMLLLLTVSLYIGAPFGFRTLIVAVAGGALYYILFVQFLGIPLPAGEVIPALFGGA